MRDIGKNIRQFRILKNMTQDELAEKLFVTRQTVSNYETGKSRPDVEMLVKISEVLETDIHQLIYGPEKRQLTPDRKRLIWAAAAAAVLGLTWQICEPLADAWKSQRFLLGPMLAILAVVKPLFLLSVGWLVGHLLAMALRPKPMGGNWVKTVRRVMLVLLVIWLVASVLFTAYYNLDEWLYATQRRGVWEEVPYESGGETFTSKGWTYLPLPGMSWLSGCLIPVLVLHEGLVVPLLYGIALGYLEPPKQKKTPD